ncbi:MAG: hypothetical protein V4702_04260 [Patescibacteria group bacterium]
MSNPNQPPQPTDPNIITHVPNAAELDMGVSQHRIPRAEVRRIVAGLALSTEEQPADKSLEASEPAKQPYDFSKAEIPQPPVPRYNTGFDARREAERQIGIARADRINRERAGLPPRVHNLT